MIDWNTLIKPENSQQTPENEAEGPDKHSCRDGQHQLSGAQKQVFMRVSEPVPTKPTFPTHDEGGGKENGNHAPGESGASDNYRDAKTYPVNPIAMCLLLTCCNKATFTKEETIEAIINLQTIPQQEQVRSWAILCYKNGIDPHRVIYPFTQSPNKGTSCQGCKHIEMLKIPTEKRPVFRFVCSLHHQILEATYVHERVLIAPESCRDYLPTA
ncbi:hypothetical protein [Nitrosomonas sp.]|uniref:hypothetical protein n=1 Tax=Nitrosomonas sp. TaxID=42353 RepID=UPI00271986A3|nr:hypothetical protein [Nitrosomonas sp.]MDO8893729.1 hypothetical protein [Nitrosomonas sp.]